jgi:hypothetical protein
VGQKIGYGMVESLFFHYFAFFTISEFSFTVARERRAVVAYPRRQRKATMLYLKR